MSRRKVILPSWTVSPETAKDTVAIKERFADLSNGEIVINTRPENVTLTTLDSNGNASHFIDETKITEIIETEVEHVKELISATSGETISWVENQHYLTEHQDISNLATKDEIPSLEGLASESWVEGKGYLTEHQNLSDYAKKSDIPSLEGYATETFVKNAIAEAELSGSDVDLSGFATQDDIKNMATKDEIPSLEGLASESWVEGKGYLTEHQDISHLATKGEIPSLSGYATEVWVKEYVADIATGGEIDLSDYAKKSDLVTSAPITLKGGVWSDVIRSVFGDTIPSGITFEDFLRRMAFAEIWPEDIETLTNLYIAIKNSTVSLSGVTNYGNVEVGTEVFLKGIMPSKTFDVRGTVEITGMDYGYINPYTGKYTEETSLTLTGITTNPIYTYGLTNNILNVNISGFTDGSGNTIESISTTGMVDDIKMYVNDGTNKIVTSQKSMNYEISSTNENIEIRYMSNMKDNDLRYTTKIEYKSGNTEDKKTYTIYSYRNTFYGVTSSTGECNAELIRSLTPTNANVKPGKTNSITFVIGETTGKRMIIASPLEIEKVWSPSLNQDITGYLKETHNDTISVPGANNFSPIKYHVYDCTWQNEFSKGNTWEIIFK